LVEENQATRTTSDPGDVKRRLGGVWVDAVAMVVYNADFTTIRLPVWVATQPGALAPDLPAFSRLGTN
jgi:hypothetical protein